MNCLLFGAFVFLFLLLFQPFELSKLPNRIGLVAFGYGMVCFAIMALLNVGVFLTFPHYFSENKWTTQKEILWTLLHVVLIGAGNYLLSVLIKIIAYSWWNLLLFEVYTLAVAVFPITTSILWNQIRLNKKFEKQSQLLNAKIEKIQHLNDAEAKSLKISIPNGPDPLELEIAHFLYAQADDNYVKIFYWEGNGVSRKLIRTTLKNVFTLFEGHQYIIKSHKSYIVNLQHVQRISGNAQGYKLHVKGTTEMIPVSRTLNSTIKRYFADNQ